MFDRARWATHTQGMLRRTQRVHGRLSLESPPVHATFALLHPWQVAPCASFGPARLSSMFPSNASWMVPAFVVLGETFTGADVGPRRYARCDSARATSSMSGAARCVALSDTPTRATCATCAATAALTDVVAARRLACATMHCNPRRAQRTHLVVLTAISHLHFSLALRHAVHARRRGAEGSHLMPRRSHREQDLAPAPASVVSEQLHLDFWHALHALRSASIRPVSFCTWCGIAAKLGDGAGAGAVCCSTSHTQNGSSHSIGAPSQPIAMPPTHCS